MEASYQREIAKLAGEENSNLVERITEAFDAAVAAAAGGAELESPRYLAAEAEATAYLRPIFGDVAGQAFMAIVGGDHLPEPHRVPGGITEMIETLASRGGYDLVELEEMSETNLRRAIGDLPPTRH